MALAAFSVMLSFMAVASYAAGIEWSSGFPKISQKNVLLQWSPVKGVTEYKVYRGEQKGKGKLVATVKTNRYIDKDLPGGKTFYYSVAAVVGGKEGARSAEGSVSIAAEKVFVPLKTPKLVGGHVKDLQGGKASVGIRWEGAAGTDLVGVNIYRSQTKGSGYAMIGSSQSDTYEDNDVERGKTYYYVVTAVDSQFKETNYSNELSMNVPAPVAEAPKQAVKVMTTTMRPAKLLFKLPSEQDARRKGGEEFLPRKTNDVAVDEAVGHIYVVSIEYGGVLVYDMEGRLQFGIRKDGVGGSEKFGIPKCVAVGPRGDVYVTDYNSPDISVFDFSGRPVGTIKVDISNIRKDMTAKNFGIAVNQDGDIYVADPVSNSIQVLNSKGRRLFEVVGIRSEAEAKKEKGKQLFNGPTFLTNLKDGDFVFVDSGWSKLLEYSKDGKFKRTIGKPGAGAGELDYPAGIATGNKGEIFVSSALSANIQAFSPDGKFLYALCNEKCNGPIEIATARGIYVDSKNRLYVTEGLSEHVSVFQLEDRTVDIIPKD